MDELHASLISHKHTLNRATNSSLEHAIKTKNYFGQGRGQERSSYRGRGRSPQTNGRSNPTSTSGRGNNQNLSQSSSQNQAQGQRYDKSQVQCNYCKNYGHYANECREKQNDMNNRQNTIFAKENKNQSNVLLTCNVAQEKNEYIWFLDSGCSNHMTRNIAMFSNLDENLKSEVTTGTDRKVSVMGKGRV